MARPRSPFPKPRRHKGAAVVDVYDGHRRRTITLGPWGSDEAHEEYQRLLARLRAAQPRPPALAPVTAAVPADLTVAEALVRYVAHVEAYYRTPDGTPTGTADDIKITVGYLRTLFGPVPLAEFDLSHFKAVRQAMVDDGRVRGQVNRRAGMVRSFVRWCVEEGLPVGVGALERLRAVRPLAPGRDGVAEGMPRTPADPAVVERVIACLPSAPAAVVRLIRLTGARPSEILRLRPREVDRIGDVWAITPSRHKGSWRGKPRVVYLGLAAQAVVAPWLEKTPVPDAYVFSPARAEAERIAARAAARKTPKYPSHLRRNAAKRKGVTRKRPPSEFYSHLALSCAVRRACLKAGAGKFTPYQLRHLKATELRQGLGLEHARAVLGHSAQAMTDHYSRAADGALAARAAAEAG